MAESTRLIVVKLDATLWQDAFDDFRALENQGIDHLDIVIANAGVCYVWPSVADAKLEDIEAHIKPNVYGPVALYQATRSLLHKSKRQPIFTTMASTAGSLNTPLLFPNAAYGPSKAAASWYTIRINIEDSWLNSFSLGPGWVHTDLGDAGAAGLGADAETQEKYMIDLDESCEGMFKLLTETTKEKHGGKLVLWNGEIIPW